MYSLKTKAQSTLEYVILIGFVVAALIAMGVYMKRGIQGKLRESTDQVGEQYSAQNFNSEYTTDTYMHQTENVVRTVGKGTTTNTNIDTNWQKKRGSEQVRGYQPGE